MSVGCWFRFDPLRFRVACGLGRVWRKKAPGIHGGTTVCVLLIESLLSVFFVDVHSMVNSLFFFRGSIVLDV